MWGRHTQLILCCSASYRDDDCQTVNRDVNCHALTVRLMQLMLFTHHMSIFSVQNKFITAKGQLCQHSVFSSLTVST